MATVMDDEEFDAWFGKFTIQDAIEEESDLENEGDQPEDSVEEESEGDSVEEESEPETD